MVQVEGKVRPRQPNYSEKKNTAKLENECWEISKQRRNAPERQAILDVWKLDKRRSSGVDRIVSFFADYGQAESWTKGVQCDGGSVACSDGGNW